MHLTYSQDGEYSITTGYNSAVAGDNGSIYGKTFFVAANNHEHHRVAHTDRLPHVSQWNIHTVDTFNISFYRANNINNYTSCCSSCSSTPRNSNNRDHHNTGCCSSCSSISSNDNYRDNYNRDCLPTIPNGFLNHTERGLRFQHQHR